MEKKFYIGIDSDGTAFDSMTAKHELSFIPAIFDVWVFGPHRDRVIELEKKINLFSKSRGVNRFPGLLMLFDKLQEEKLSAYDHTALRAFCESGKSMSNKALEEFIAENPSDFLNEVLEWSRIADLLFEKETLNLMPFKGVRPALKKAYEKADISVVSSASTAGLRADWEKDSLSDYVTYILGQDSGTKKQQLQLTAQGKYEPEKILMIGDAIGDMEAAKSIGALFYPIIPGREENCWRRLEEKSLNAFFEGRYKGSYEDRLIEEFLEVLE